MFGLGITEIIVILLAVGILLFGSKKIVELARSMGRFSGEFKKGKREIENEIKKAEQEGVESTPEAPAREAAPAEGANPTEEKNV